MSLGIGYLCLWYVVDRLDCQAGRSRRPVREIALYIEASDLLAFHSRLEAAGARIVDPLAERPWGQQEFTVEDHEGNWLTFWKKNSTD